MNLTKKTKSTLIKICGSGLLFLSLTSAVFAAPPIGLDAVRYEFAPKSSAMDAKLLDDRANLLKGIEDSIQYLKSQTSEEGYTNFESAGLSRALIEKSLERFHTILLRSESMQEVESELQKEFMLFKAKGSDGKGKVKFTGYFQPSYRASHVKTDEFRFPIFSLPDDFSQWSEPHPKRVNLEGYDGLGGPGTKLEGHELAYLANRFDVFMIQLQGSAILEFDDGKKQSIGFAAGTHYPFTGIPSDMIKKYKIAWANLSEFFGKNPDLFNQAYSRNNRFIFFKENPQSAPLGGLGIPVIAGRSIATDKMRFPPGALGFIRTHIPVLSSSGRIELENSFRIVLDLDCGSAIKGPGRVDFFVGSGPQAQRLANNIYGSGELYYLILKNSQPSSKPVPQEKKAGKNVKEQIAFNGL